MGRSTPTSLALKLYLALNSVALLGAAVLMALLARSGGYSTPRMLLVGAAAILGVAAAALVPLLRRNPPLEHRLTSLAAQPGTRLRSILAGAFIAFWCLAWFPPQYTADAYYYFIAIYPLILCGLLLSGSALIWVTAVSGSSTPWWTVYFRRQRGALIVALLMLAVSAVVALLAARLRILQGFEPYWYGAGVPLLAAHVLIALGIAVFALRAEDWDGHRRLPADTILFILIWVLAALLWAWRPVPPSYWVTAPRPPNFELYPFSDPATYDVGSQFALIGQGIFNGMAFDRALYMSFLVYLHLIGGQDYQELMAIQAAIFAVFPAVLYLIGRRLHGRTAGLVLAVLITLRGLTSLDASAWIDTANFKHMLTDFPTAIGVAVFLLLLLKWTQAPQERISDLIWAGGVLGLTSLLRPHVLLLLAGAVGLALWVYRPRLGRGMLAGGLASLAFLTAVLPWLTFGPSSGSLAAQYGDRVRAVIAQRFPRLTETPAPASTPVSSQVPALETPVVPPPTSPIPAPPAAEELSPPADPGPPFVVDHFLHNLITSALILPGSPELLSVRSVVKDGEAFWRPRWSGGMGALSAAMLMLNLAVIAFGLGTAVQRHALRGLVPLGVFLLYLGADSAARTSGGRYLVPVDWILIVYFSIAVAETVQAVASSLANSDRARQRVSRPVRSHSKTRPVEQSLIPGPVGGRHIASHPLTAFVLVLVIGGLVPFAGVPFAKRFGRTDSEPMLRALEGYTAGVGATQEIHQFLQQPDAIIVEGRLLYPLHYRQGEGEPTRYAPYTSQDFPRTVFVHIGPRGLLHVILPGGRTRAMPDASDAIVLGCRVPGQTFNLVQAIAVVLPDHDLGFVRSPAAALACPIPDPVCDGNGNCR